MDARGIPTQACPCCGSVWFKVVCGWDEGLPAAFLSEAECADCGCLVTLADPRDIEGMQ